MRVFVTASVFLCGAVAIDAQPQQNLLPGTRRVLFLGDSITYDGKYIAAFETAWRLQFKDRPFEIINCGLPSETVSGLSEQGHAGGKFPRPDLHERLDRVLAKTKPDLVFACYGMNDGIYLPSSDERFRKFKEGMTKLHEKVEAAGAKIVHLTPPVFDALPIKKRVAPADKVTANNPFEDYDQVLERSSAWLVEMRGKGWVVIDMHGPMKAALAEKRKTEPMFTFAPDGVHPNAAGHLLMAQIMARGLGAPFDPAKAAGEHAKLFAQIHNRQRILTDAWLTDIGHKRPMNKGLPRQGQGEGPGTGTADRQTHQVT